MLRRRKGTQGSGYHPSHYVCVVHPNTQIEFVVPFRKRKRYHGNNNDIMCPKCFFRSEVKGERGMVFYFKWYKKPLNKEPSVKMNRTRPSRVQ